MTTQPTTAGPAPCNIASAAQPMENTATTPTVPTRGEHQDSATYGERPAPRGEDTVMENTDFFPGDGERHYEPRRTLDPPVAAMLRRYRQARCWSYRRAGRETGVAYGYLAELEAARRAPSTVVAEALISAYRLNPADAAALRSEALSGVGRDWRPVA